MGSLIQLNEFRFDPETETMYKMTGEGWAELGCSECDWHTYLPVPTLPVVVLDE